jgi:hypothetical protein
MVLRPHLTMGLPFREVASPVVRYGGIDPPRHIATAATGFGRMVDRLSPEFVRVLALS